MIIEPKTLAEHAFHGAIVTLLNSNEPPTFSLEQFVNLAKAAPDYALRTIESNRSQLTPMLLHRAEYTPDSARGRTSQFVMTAEWELKGASKFIGDHNIAGETEFTLFMDKRLETHPNAFSLPDLNSLLAIYRKDVPIRRRVLQEIDRRVTSVASELTANQSGE